MTRAKAAATPADTRNTYTVHIRGGSPQTVRADSFMIDVGYVQFITDKVITAMFSDVAQVVMLPPASEVPDVD